MKRLGAMILFVGFLAGLPSASGQNSMHMQHMQKCSNWALDLQPKCRAEPTPLRICENSFAYRSPCKSTCSATCAITLLL